MKLQKKGVASLVLKKISSSDLNPSIPPFILSAENVELVNDSLEVKISSGNENDTYLLLVGGDDFSRNMDSGKKGMWTFFADEENLSVTIEQFLTIKNILQKKQVPMR